MLVRKSYFYFIAVIFSLFINLLFIESGHADPLTITSSNQMSAGEIRTFTATGGTSPYTWGIASGGGETITPAGEYTAPTTNPNCNYHPTVCVKDSYGQQDCKEIAINGYTGDRYAYGTKSGYSCIQPHLHGSEYMSVEGSVLNNQYRCDGTRKPVGSWNCTDILVSGITTCRLFARCWDGSCTQCYTWDETPYELECGDEVMYYPMDVCQSQTYGIPNSGGIVDLRGTVIPGTGGALNPTAAEGCCPAQLALGSGAADSKTNTKGNICLIAKTLSSSANLKSGNLYHDQDVGILTLSYNSIDTYNGVLGKKWTHQYNQQLTVVDSSTLVLRTEDGNVITFRLSSGVYYPEAISGDTSRIVKNTSTYTRTLKNGTTQVFNASGLLTSITDRNSNTITLTYSGGNLSGIIDKNNRTTAIATTNGKITGITDALNRTHSLTYTDGLLTAVTDPLGNAWHYTYDTAGRMLTKIDPLNNSITYTYDASGKLLTSTDPSGKVRTMTYPQSGASTFTEKDGGVWTYTYDPVYSVKTSQTDPLGNITRYTYDLKRNLTSVIAPDNSATTYTYDASGNLLTQTDPLGKTTTYTYNSLNLATSVTDPKGNITRYGYDALGNLTSITDALNHVTTYTYDSRGNITSITNPLSKTTAMTYDSYNNLLTVTDPKSGIVAMTYDAAGNMITQTDALNKVTTFLYNNLNQLTQITDPRGTITQYTYDYQGNRLTSTDGNNNPTYFTYNYKGQVTQITDALNHQTGMAYGSTGCSSCGGVDKLTSLTDAKSHTTAYTYDQRGKLLQETDPLGKTTAYTYDGKGNLITRTDADNKTIAYSYDLNNRLTGKTYSDNTSVVFQYDDAGNMTYAGNQNIAYNFTYDANNRITQITDSNSRTIQYTYDAAGNRASMVTPGNKTTTYTYDNNNQISQIATDLGNFTFTYDAANRRITRTFPNGTVSTYAYDDDSRLTGITTTNGGTTIDSATYTLDGAGNRLSKTQNSTIVDYTYDNIYRLTSASPTGTTQAPEAYTYDAVGNRLTSAYEQPPSVNETTTYGYDGENRLTGIQITQGSNVKQLAFAYDPFGRRISKTIVQDGIGTDCTTPNTCPRTTTYLYDGQNIILEYNTSSEIVTRYTHGPSIDEPLAIEIKNTTSYTPYYYHADGLGSITALSNASGSIVQRYEYDSFGNQTITTNGGIKQPFTFTAREYDQETGLYFYRARYYDPKVGRFVTKDPISFAGGDVNLYAYVGNNPVTGIDPSGMMSEPLVIGWGIALAEPTPIGEIVMGGVTVGVGVWGLYNIFSNGKWIDHPDAKKEHDEYKDLYRMPPPPGMNECELLKWKLQREEQLLKNRQNWDNKWASGTHSEPIRQSQRAIEKLKRKIEKVCKPCP